MEEPLEPERVLRGLAAEEVSVVLLDCLTMWMSNLMGGLGHGVDEVVDRVRDLAAAALACPVPVVIVSNEVGQGIVPDNKMARDFRDAAGWAHQELARAGPGCAPGRGRPGCSVEVGGAVSRLKVAANE